MADVYAGWWLAPTLNNSTNDQSNFFNMDSASAIGNSPHVIYYYYLQQGSNPSPQPQVPLQLPLPLPLPSLTQLPPLLTHPHLFTEGAGLNQPQPQPQVLLPRAMAPIVGNCYLPALALQLVSSKLFTYYPQPASNPFLPVNPYHLSLMQPASQNQSFVNALSQQTPLVWPPRVTAPSLMPFLPPTAFAQMANGVQNLMPAGAVPPQATSLMATNETLDPNLDMLMTSARSVSEYFAEQSNGSSQYTGTSTSSEGQTCAEIQANASNSFNLRSVMNAPLDAEAEIQLNGACGGYMPTFSVAAQTWLDGQQKQQLQTLKRDTGALEGDASLQLSNPTFALPVSQSTPMHANVRCFGATDARRSSTAKETGALAETFAADCLLSSSYAERSASASWPNPGVSSRDGTSIIRGGSSKSSLSPEEYTVGTTSFSAAMAPVSLPEGHQRLLKMSSRVSEGFNGTGRLQQFPHWSADRPQQRCSRTVDRRRLQLCSRRAPVEVKKLCAARAAQKSTIPR